MHYFRATVAVDNADHVEPVVVPGTPVLRNPVPRRPGQLTLLPPMHRSQRTSISARRAGLHFDERHDASSRAMPFTRPGSPLDNQVDIPMTTPKPARENDPAPACEPLLREPLSAFTQYLPRRQHDPILPPIASTTTSYCAARKQNRPASEPSTHGTLRRKVATDVHARQLS